MDAAAVAPLAQHLHEAPAGTRKIVAGTDHGTAAPVFVIGTNAKPGVVGNHPSLSDLDQGDLKFGTDFRSVYAALLTNWMGADSARVLRGEYAPAPVIA